MMGPRDEVMESVRRALRQSADGDVQSMGDFTQYADEDEDCNKFAPEDQYNNQKENSDFNATSVGQ